MRSKTEIRFFSILDYDKEQEYLREMNKAGWRFVSVSGICVYHFEECEPEDVIYQLDYNREGREHKSEYLKLFSDCGWEYIQDYYGFSYFRKPASASGSDEIFCDDDSKREMLGRVFRGRMIPLAVIFACVLLPQFILTLFERQEYGVATFFGVMTGLYIAIFVCFAIKYVGYIRKK